MNKKYLAIIATILFCGCLGLILWLQGNKNWQQLIPEYLRLDSYEFNIYPNSSNTFQRDLNKPLVVFFGDSRAYEWPAIANIPFQFFNQGINGETTSQVLGRVYAHVTSISPKFVVIQVGINDLKHIATSPNESRNIVVNCKKNIQKIVDELVKEEKITVILTTVFPVPNADQLQRSYWSDDVDRAVIEVNQFIKSLKSDRVIILDAASLLANEQGEVRQIYSRDFLHLNDDGYTMLNKELSKILAN
jgi:lysophospholipase L1-like esterase